MIKLKCDIVFICKNEQITQVTHTNYDLSIYTIFNPVDFYNAIINGTQYVVTMAPKSIYEKLFI
jgi:hypothetical protein